MSNSQTVAKKFRTLKSSSYICVKGYENSLGEVANHTVNVNVDIGKAKQTDLETLESFDEKELQLIATNVGADFETAQQALSELIVSHKRNLSDNPTNQSKGQQDAYVNIGQGLRIKENENGTFDLYVTGFANNKTVIVEGQTKLTNSRPKTLVKKAISKNLKMGKFRNFKLQNAESLTVTGDTIQIS